MKKLIKVKNTSPHKIIVRATHVFRPNSEVGPLEVTDYQYTEIKGSQSLKIIDMEQEVTDSDNKEEVVEETVNNDNEMMQEREETSDNEEENLKEPEKEESAEPEEEKQSAVGPFAEIPEELESLLLKELRELGKDYGVENYWSKNKSTLISDLRKIKEGE